MQGGSFLGSDLMSDFKSPGHYDDSDTKSAH